MDDKTLLALIDDPNFTDTDYQLLTADEKARLDQLTQPSSPQQPNSLSQGLKAATSPLTTMAGLPFGLAERLARPVGAKIEEMSASGLRGLGAGAGAIATGASPADATIEASRFVKDPSYTPSTTSTTRNLGTNVGAVIGEGFSPTNMVLGEGLGAGMRAIVPPVAGGIAGLFGKGSKSVEKGIQLAKDPLGTNLLTPATRRETIAATRQGITDLAGNIDSLAVVDPIMRGLRSSTRSAGTRAPLQRLLRDMTEATDEAGKIPSSRAQEILSDFSNQVAGYGKEIPTRAKTMLQKVHNTAQKSLETEVPGLAGINKTFARQYAGKPFEPLLNKPGLASSLAIGGGVLGAGSGLGLLSLSPRLAGLAAQGIGLGTKLATTPVTTGPTVSALRRLFLQSEDKANARQ